MGTNAPFTFHAATLAHIGTVTAYIAAVTARIRPFEPTATAYEKMVFVPSDPHMLLNVFPQCPERSEMWRVERDIPSGVRQFNFLNIFRFYEVTRKMEKCRAGQVN